jgi:zinc transport system permease protein
MLMSFKKASFMGDALAHSSLAGVALGLWAGVSPVLAAGVYALGAAAVLPYLQKITRYTADTLLSIVLPFSMGLGVVIFSILPGYQPQLMGYLFGSIVGVTWLEVWLVVGLAVVSVVVWTVLRKKLLLVALDPDYAQLIGIKRWWFDVVYHLWLAVVIIAGVKLVGVILINALLVIPVATAQLHSKSLAQLSWLAPLLSIVGIVVGLLVSLLFNLPTGGAIAVVLGLMFGVGLVAQL